ncbi:MAG: hypothetical protein WA880_14465 [Ornithinimicrobium sp.]
MGDWLLLIGLVPGDTFTYEKQPDGGMSTDEYVTLHWTSPDGVDFDGSEPIGR